MDAPLKKRGPRAPYWTEDEYIQRYGVPKAWGRESAGSYLTMRQSVDLKRPGTRFPYRIRPDIGHDNLTEFGAAPLQAMEDLMDYVDRTLTVRPKGWR